MRLKIKQMQWEVRLVLKSPPDLSAKLLGELLIRRLNVLPPSSATDAPTLQLSKVSLLSKTAVYEEES